MDIRTKFSFVLVGVALLSMLGFGAAIFGSAAGALRESRLAQLDALAVTKRDVLFQMVTSWRDRVDLVASRTRLRQELRAHNVTGDPDAATRLEHLLADGADAAETIEGLLVEDDGGAHVASVGELAHDDPDAGSPPEPGGAASSVAPGGTPTFEGVFRTPDGELRSRMAVTLRVEGDVIGTLRATLNARSLEALIEDRTGLGESGRAVVVLRDPRGEPLVLRTPTEDRAFGGPASGVASADLVRLALEGAEGRYADGTTDARGNPVWGAIRQVPEIDGAVAVMMHASEARAPLAAFRDQLARLALALAAFAILFAVILAARFSKPIHELADAARRVGSGELDARAPVSTRDEVGLLARTFNEMAEKLERQMTHLREYELLFDSSLDMLCIAGTDGYFKRVNPAFERITGWSTEEVLSRPIVDFVHPDDVERTAREIEKLAEGIPTISFQNRWRCADGSYKTILWTSHPDPESGLLYSVGRDITELKREVEAELRTDS